MTDVFCHKGGKKGGGGKKKAGRAGSVKQGRLKIEELGHTGVEMMITGRMRHCG